MNVQKHSIFRNIPSLGVRDHSELSVQCSMLLNDGPYDLYKFACDKYGYLPLEAGYVGKCHLCVDVRRYLSSKNESEELQPVSFYNFIDAQVL